MTKNNYQQMAAEFMNLWQKQLASVVGDKQFIHAMLEMMNTFQNQGPHGRQDTANPFASHAASAPDDGNGLLAQLAFRLEMCERRIAALEAGRAKVSPKPRKSPAKGSKPKGK